MGAKNDRYFGIGDKPCQTGVAGSVLIKAKMQENNYRVHLGFQCGYHPDECRFRFGESDPLQDATWDKIERGESCESCDSNAPPGDLDNIGGTKMLLHLTILDLEIGGDERVSTHEQFAESYYAMFQNQSSITMSGIFGDDGHVLC
jgi:hypothetical protein